MNLNRPWLAPVLAGVIMLAITYQSVGGFEGLEAHPTSSLILVGFVMLVAAPILWLTYRKQKREPVFVELAEPEPVTASEDITPQTVLSSHWKAFISCLIVTAASTPWLALGWAQPGVCRVVSIAAWAPWVLGGIVITAVGIFIPERLMLAPEGLTLTTAWSTKHWSWNEIRKVTVMKLTLLFRRVRPTTGLMFHLFAPVGAPRGRALQGFRPWWRMSVDELAHRLNKARARWSTQEGDSFVPMRQSLLHYLQTFGIFLSLGIVLWLFIFRPCGP